MRDLQQHTIRHQVLAVIVVFLVPLTAVVIWSASRTLAERERELLDQAGSVATTSAAYLNQYLDGIDSLAAVLVRHPAVRGLESNECDRLFADLVRGHPIILNVTLTTPDGAWHGAAVRPAVERAAQPPPYVGQVVSTGQSVVSELMIGSGGKPAAVVLAYPVRGDAGPVAGVLGIALNLSQLQIVFASIPLPEGSVVTLFDRSGRVLARSRDAERYIGTRLSEQVVEPKDAPRTTTRKGIDGIERIFGNSLIDRGPWLLSVGIPVDVASMRTQSLWRRNVIILVVILGMMILAILWFARHISQELDRLRLAARRIADGDLTPPARSRVPSLEFANLQDSFITMAENVREARASLDRQVGEERKIRETLQSLQRQVVRQERLAAVGLLVSGVAHELNNPLQAILGTSELIERRPGLDPEVLEEVSFIKTQSGRAREIIRNLSRFSSQQTGPPTLVDLRDVISEVVQLRRRDLQNAGIALDVDVSSVRPAQANFTEIEQVTLNFVINAQQAVESANRKDGRILIRLFDQGKKVRLEVLDNGPGVRPEDEAKLFQPFFTTKPVGKGTGLGLSVSYGIIESYGGLIGHRPNEWGGATFFFELPAAGVNVPA